MCIIYRLYIGVARIFSGGGTLFQKFSKKISKNFLKTIAKNALFSHIFQKHLAIHTLNFCTFWPKTQFVGDFWENFRKFWKDFFRKLLKCIILAYFSNKLTNYALILCEFGRKAPMVGKFWENSEIFWWKFDRKIEFFIFLFFSKIF